MDHKLLKLYADNLLDEYVKDFVKLSIKSSPLSRTGKSRNLSAHDVRTLQGVIKNKNVHKVLYILKMMDEIKQDYSDILRTVSLKRCNGESIIELIKRCDLKFSSSTYYKAHEMFTSMLYTMLHFNINPTIDEF